MSKTHKQQTALRKAVNWLKYTGKIEKDEDLANIFKLAKNTISQYLNGKPGEKFLKDFEEHFKVTVSSFEHSSKKIEPNDDSNSNNLFEESLSTKDELIKSLQETVVSQKKIIKFLEFQLSQVFGKEGKDIYELETNQTLKKTITKEP